MVTTESGNARKCPPASCRDKGRGGACPRWGATLLLHEIPTGSRCHQDKHKAPTLPHIRPLSLQDGSRTFPHAVFTSHQDAGAACGPLIPEFGRQSSSSALAAIHRALRFTRKDRDPCARSASAGIIVRVIMSNICRSLPKSRAPVHVRKYLVSQSVG